MGKESLFPTHGSHLCLHQQCVLRRQAEEIQPSRFSSPQHPWAWKSHQGRFKSPSASICVLSTGVHTDNMLPGPASHSRSPVKPQAPRLSNQRHEDLVPPCTLTPGPLRTYSPYPHSALILISWSPLPLIPPWLKLVLQLVPSLQLHPCLPAAFYRTFPKPSQTPFRISPNLHPHLPQSGPCPSACTTPQLGKAPNTSSDTNHTVPPRCAHRPSLLRLPWQSPASAQLAPGLGYSLQGENPGRVLLVFLSHPSRWAPCWLGPWLWGPHSPRRSQNSFYGVCGRIGVGEVSGPLQDLSLTPISETLSWYTARVLEAS